MRTSVLLGALVLSLAALPVQTDAAVIEDFESPVLDASLWRTTYRFREYPFARIDGTVLIDAWRLASGTSNGKKPDGTGEWDLTIIDDVDDDGISIGDVGYFKFGPNGTQAGYTNIQDWAVYLIDSTDDLDLGNLAPDTSYKLTMITRTDIGDTAGNGAVTDRSVELGLVAGGVELGTFASVSLTANTTQTLTYTLTAAEVDVSGQVGHPLSIRIKGSFIGEDDGLGFIGNVQYDDVAICVAGLEDTDGDGIGDVCDDCPFDPDNDADGDGVCGAVDECPDTVIPEGVPTIGLKNNRWALTDDDITFDTVQPSGKGPALSFTTEDTAGCSCEQIIEELGLGSGQTRFGCSISNMRTWVELVGNDN